MDQLFNSISFKTGEVITKTYSTSFSIAVSLLNKEMREAIHSVYGFVRLADEIVDTFHSEDQKQLLAEFERELESALHRGMSLNPVLHCFAVTVKKYGISRVHIDAFMKSMRADLYKNVYHSDNETDEYIYGSAEVVGLMCLKVFVEGNQVLYDELEGSAKSLGAAFQKVNFLRDLKADYEDLQRTYFAGFDKDSFDEAEKMRLIEDIDTDFQHALQGIKRLPGSSKIAVWLAYLYYSQLLRKLKKTPAKKIISTRIRVNNYVKMSLYVRAYLSYKLKLI